MPLHIHRTEVEHSGGCQEKFKILSNGIEWTAHQDRNIERTSYYNCDTSGVITEITYTGWRLNGKYKYEDRPDHFQFEIKFLASAKPKLDKFLQALKSRFPTSKLLHLNDPFTCSIPNRISLNLSIIEDEMEDQTLLENFFRMLTAIDPSTVKVVSDIKDTISSDCLHWFKVMLNPNGYCKIPTEADLKKRAKSKLHHNNLQDVPSPFYLAAEYIQKTDPEFAMELLDEIPLFHWQYLDAQSLKEAIAQKLLEHEKCDDKKIDCVKSEREKEAQEGVDEAPKVVLFLAHRLDKKEGLQSTGTVLQCSGSVKDAESESEVECAKVDSTKSSDKSIKSQSRFS